MGTQIPLRSIVTLVLLILAMASTVLSAFLFTGLERIVHSDLYRYGLQSDYQWTVQYWTNSVLVMSFLAMGMVATVVSMMLILICGRTRQIDSAGYYSWLFLISAVLTHSLCALFLHRLDYVVYNDLYRYGLRFSYEWAGQYWTYTRLMLDLLGVAVVTSVISIAFIFMSRRHALRLEGRARPIIPFEKTPASVPSTVTEHSSAAAVKQIVASEAELKKLRRMVWSYRRLPTRLAGYIVTSIGAVVLLGSMVFSSTVWAIVGLPLTFWGVLFFFFKPISLVKADVLDSATLSLLKNVNRLVSEFGLRGKGVYLPPRYLKDLSGGLVFVSARDEVCVPTMDEVGEAEDRIFLRNPDGICLVPSGVALTNLLERELGTSFAKVNLEYLEKNLPKVFVEDLEIAEAFELSVDESRIHVRIEGSIYKELCDEARRLSKVCEVFGCPVCTSIACASARASGKPIVMEGNDLSADGKAMDIYYRVIEE